MLVRWPQAISLTIISSSPYSGCVQITHFLFTFLYCFLLSILNISYKIGFIVVLKTQGTCLSTEGFVWRKAQQIEIKRNKHVRLNTKTGCLPVRKFFLKLFLSASLYNVKIFSPYHRKPGGQDNKLCVNRAIFIWVSKMIQDCFVFCFTSLCDWSRKHLNQIQN